MKRRIFLGALAMASATAPLFAQQEKSAFPVEIKISGKPYQAVLFDNATVRAIRSQLPLKMKNGRPVRPRTLLSIQSPASDGQRCLYKV